MKLERIYSAGKLGRWLGRWLETLSLEQGKHAPDGKFCVMEAVAYVAGEPWSDHPKCACPVITAFMVNWNDSLPDNATRDRLLKPLIPLLVDTRSTKTVETIRSYMALDWFIREYVPAWFDLTPSLKPHGDALRAADQIVSIAAAKAVAPKIIAARAAAARAAAAGAAAWAAAGAAAGAAARAAARAAAEDAARAAARAAAWDAAEDAAGDAAWAAAEAAAWDAAGVAAEDTLQPTVERLQVSANDLVRRMCAVKP